LKTFIYKTVFILFQIIFLLSGCRNENNQIIDPNIVETDSINYWISLSKNKSLKIDHRKDYLLKAYHINSKLEDSIKNRNLLKIAFEAYKLKDTSVFIKANLEALKISKKLQYTFGIADTHWNFGNFFTKGARMDSAYYHYNKAFLNFNSIKHEYYSGKMLYNMAFIQSRFKNYLESEILIFQAISKFESLKKDFNIYQSYNRLGLIFTELKEYEKAIFYHNKALDYLKKGKNKKTYINGSLNNIGLVYQKSGDFKTAIQYFEKALEKDSVKIKNINLYARLIDNLAYTKFLNGDTEKVLNEFNIALKIRDSLHNKTDVTISKIHLAEYFAKNKDTLNAIDHAKSALDLSRNVKNNRDILASLKLLSVIDKANTDIYLSNYISLTDSLQTEERKVRDKFTRIQYETDEYIQETKILSKQKNQILIGSFFIIAILTLLFYMKKQQARNKELYLEQKQQKANEEIYKLMLEQQTKKNEGKIQERNRIAEELHDGVLGRLFGTRMGMGFLDVNGDTDAQKKYQSFLDEMQGIEKEIRSISHELKDNLLKDDQSFIEILKTLLSEQKKITGIDSELQADASIPWNTMDNSVQMNLYRLIQEALQNINKHAHATKVEVIFSMYKEILHLTIKDDGVGFDVQKAKKGIGIKNMISRVQKLGGVLKIDSTPGHGTSIEIKIPV